MKKLARIIIVSLIISTTFCAKGFAAKLDGNIPLIPSNTISIDSDGTVAFTPVDYYVIATISGIPTKVSNWKKFEAQLLKRYSVIVSGNTKYTYKTCGSVVSCESDENEITFNFTSTGYYQVQVRGVNLEGNYGNWSWISGCYPQKIGDQTDYEGLPISEEDIGAGGSSSGGSSSSSGGPGVVQTGTLPAGYQYAVLGPNGEILYYYGGNTSNGIYSGMGNNNGMGYYQASGNQQILGPGYANNMQGAGQILYPNTGVSNYQQVEAPNVNGNNYIYSGQTGSSSINNPNYYNGAGSNTTPSGNNMQYTPQITQGLEIGWHVDSHGRFYYQGNGSVLKSTWYLIDSQYYRFGDNGYLLANQWFKDATTGQWYYLSGDGHMLTGWQNLNGTWYYFKSDIGQGYGTMYANTATQINDPVWGYGNYAFDANGAMVKNAWYNGHYYGNDGNRTN